MNYTQEELEALANQELSYMNGGGGYRPMDYTGADDALLAFGGAGHSFVQSDPTKHFRFSLKHDTPGGAPATIYLSSGLDFALEGLISDGGFLAEGGVVTVQGVAQGGSIRKFLNFCMLYPTAIAGMKITAKTASQVDSPITIERETPWMGKDLTTVVSPSGDNDQYVNQVNTVKFETPGLIFGSNHKVSYIIQDGEEIFVDIWGGASVDLTKYLERRKALAMGPATNYHRPTPRPIAPSRRRFNELGPA